MRSSLLALVAVYLASSATATPVAEPDPDPAAEAASSTQTAVEQPSSAPQSQTPVVQGCFSSKGNLTLNSREQFNSRGKCGHDICLAAGYTVAATSQGNLCFCGDAYPPADSLVDDSKCNVGCSGYGQDACGGGSYYTVYNTGLDLYGIPVYEEPSSSSSASSSKTSSTSTGSPTTKPTVSTTTAAGGETVFVTQTPTAAAETTSAAPEKKSSTGSTVGIAVGTVAGVIVAAAAIGGAIFFIRRRRNREIEDEYRRNAAVNAFFNGKPPGSSGGYSGSDTRLDPVMAQRRFSDGSIADNQDYSRKILRVTNA